MKIHDKYVIELKEVIKGYGNDSTVQDPLKLPCDYKFYEIDGIAICEKSFKKMTPLNDLVLKALEDIKAEIDKDIDDLKEVSKLTIATRSYMSALVRCRELIDKKVNEVKHENTERDS